MAQITYTYEIVSKNLENNTFDVLYQSEGKQPVTATIESPFVGDMADVEILIQRHSPVIKWINETRTRADIQVGTTGLITSQFPDYD